MSTLGTKEAGYVATNVLASAGVRRLYTVPGESFLEILDAAEVHPDLSLVSTRHESGAAFMAEAEGKLTGTLAVAMATRGVGASNLAIGVHTARQDSTPMLILLGQVETEFLGREAFQEVDLAAFYAPITKWSATVHRADAGGLSALLARILEEAGAARVVVPAGLPQQWLADVPEHIGVVVDDGDLSAAQLDGVDAVVTGCAVAIAETGTVVLDAGPDQGRRLVTLVPDHHVCVVAAEQIVATVPEGLARLDPRRPLTMISGPSATSDIELDRVEGVHGPRNLDVVIVAAA